MSEKMIKVNNPVEDRKQSSDELSRSSFQRIDLALGTG